MKPKQQSRTLQMVTRLRLLGLGDLQPGKSLIRRPVGRLEFVERLGTIDKTVSRISTPKPSRFIQGVPQL